MQISPDGRYVTYELYQSPTGAKNTIVPNYVTESGFTTDIPGRTKVGAPQGHYTFFVYDRTRDTVMEVRTDSIPGITEAPDYQKDYPSAKHPDHPRERWCTFDGPLIGTRTAAAPSSTSGPRISRTAGSWNWTPPSYRRP